MPVDHLPLAGQNIGFKDIFKRSALVSVAVAVYKLQVFGGARTTFGKRNDVVEFNFVVRDRLKTGLADLSVSANDS